MSKIAPLGEESGFSLDMNGSLHRQAFSSNKGLMASVSLASAIDNEEGAPAALSIYGASAAAEG
jgi:lipid-binding SYLF domain-containing protein